MSEAVNQHDDMTGNWIPPAVRRAAIQADALMREASQSAGNPDPAGDQGAGDQGGQDTPRPAAPPAAPGPATWTPPVQPPAPAPQPPPAQPPAQPVDWEQRFATLQGKYNAEVVPARDRARDAETRLADIERRFQELQLQQMPAGRPAPTVVEIPPEDIEAYGQELPDAARRWARAEVAPEMAAMRQEIAQLRGTSQSSALERAQERVKAALSAWKPDWESINTDPEFHEWLRQPDPFSGLPRQGLMGQAYNAGDSNRTLNFFRAFIYDTGKYGETTEHTAARPSAPAQPHTPAAPGGAGPSLQDLAAPGRGRPASPGAPNEKRTWSAKQIEAFYSDSSRGRFKGREAEYARLEADLNAAMLEGRILG